MMTQALPLFNALSCWVPLLKVNALSSLSLLSLDKPDLHPFGPRAGTVFCWTSCLTILSCNIYLIWKTTPCLMFLGFPFFGIPDGGWCEDSAPSPSVAVSNLQELPLLKRKASTAAPCQGGHTRRLSHTECKSPSPRS